jgi:hypothetical protein
VKKASRELNNQTSKLDDIQKIDTLQKRCADLFAEMKRHERDNLKNKKRADQLQKEKDHSRTELNKNVSLREKLEKLCRELQRENNRLKVCVPTSRPGVMLFALPNGRIPSRPTLPLVLM